MIKMNPVPTEYDGIVYRSKSEAMFSFVLDGFFGSPAKLYEPYETSSGYRPDFSIVFANDGSFAEMIIEYKPSETTDSYCRKLCDNFKELRESGIAFSKKPGCWLFEMDMFIDLPVPEVYWFNPDSGILENHSLNIEDRARFAMYAREAKKYRFDLKSEAQK